MTHEQNFPQISHLLYPLIDLVKNIKFKAPCLPDFRFSGGLMTRLLDRLTRRDLRLTSLRNVVALSWMPLIGLLVGVTQ